MNLFLLISIGALWLLGLGMLDRTKLHFFKFLLGSIGIFLISMIFFSAFLESRLSLIISEALEHLAQITSYFTIFKENSILSFETKTGIISMFIDYECSGVVEMLVFTSLAMFFPFGGSLRKAGMILGGSLFIFFANLVRILMIVFISRSFGAEYFYLAHTLLGRIVFFALMVVLYYFVFTSTHLKYQHVGEMK